MATWYYTYWKMPDSPAIRLELMMRWGCTFFTEEYVLDYSEIITRHYSHGFLRLVRLIHEGFAHPTHDSWPLLVGL